MMNMPTIEVRIPKTQNNNYYFPLMLNSFNLFWKIINEVGGKSFAGKYIMYYFPFSSVVHLHRPSALASHSPTTQFAYFNIPLPHFILYLLVVRSFGSLHFLLSLRLLRFFPLLSTRSLPRISQALAIFARKFPKRLDEETSLSHPQIQ